MTTTKGREGGHYVRSRGEPLFAPAISSSLSLSLSLSLSVSLRAAIKSDRSERLISEPGTNAIVKKPIDALRVAVSDPGD